MRFSFTSALVVALAAESAVASTWFSKAAYNKWHETELERWLSDHDIPYPKAADRKELENLVKENWQTAVASPYAKWDSNQIQAYLSEKGQEAEATAAANKDTLLSKIKSSWYETEDQAGDAWHSVKDWILDSWTDSQLKAFLDKHGIPCPQPRKRDVLLATARDNYDSIAKKAGETTAYPGNWLYETWSESDLKAWLDERGIPVPQPTTRDKLIAQVRRNSRLASLKAKASGSQASASASSAAASAKESLSDAVLDTWSDSQLKEFFDKNGIKVPQGSKRNELVALARKHRASFTGDTVASSASSIGSEAASSASSYWGAATSKAGNQAAKATDDVKLKAEDLFNSAIGTWSDTRLKAYLDSRGVPVPQNGKRDELLAQVRLQKHKAATGWSAWTFDTWTVDNLKKYLSTQGDKAAKKAAEKKDATREELVKQAQQNYAKASKSGGTAYASATSYLAQQTDSAKDATFDTWTDSDLKSYLDSYGIPVYQGTTTNELRALARRQYNYFKYGTNSPSGTIFAKLSETANWLWDQISKGAAAGRKEVGKKAEVAGDYAKEYAQTATNRAEEAAARATHRVKEEL